MNESDAVENPMLARRIAGAQKKFAEGVLPDSEANSVEEWLLRTRPSS
jgi:hypothetical protein